MQFFKRFNSGLITITTLVVMLISLAVNAKSIDQIVAIVNDEVITQAELDRQLAIVKKQLSSTNTQIPPDLVLKKQVLQHLINIDIQLQYAKRVGLTIENTELDDVVNNIAQQNQFTVDQLKAEIEKSGMQFSDYLDNLRKEITVSRLQQQAIASTVKVSPDEVKFYLEKNAEQVKDNQEFLVHNILIPLSDTPEPDELVAAKDKANKILAYLKQGGDFSQTAIAESSGEFALQGGDLGWRKLSELPSIFEKKVSQMDKGEVAGPIRAGNGLHIIKLVDQRGKPMQHIVTLTKVRHILIKEAEGELVEDTKARLLSLKKRIEKGENFADLAKQYSLDVLSAEKGGDLGWVGPGKLVPKFEQAMNELKVGEISEPVFSRYGWHLIQVLSRREVDDTENYREQEVRQNLFKRKFATEVNDWLQKLQHSAYIKILDESLQQA